MNGLNAFFGTEQLGAGDKVTGLGSGVGVGLAFGVRLRLWLGLGLGSAQP